MPSHDHFLSLNLTRHHTTQVNLKKHKVATYRDVSTYIKSSLFTAHLICTGIIYFILSSVGSYSRAMNYCLTISSSSHWLAYRKKIRLQLASFFNLSATGVMFRLCPTTNSEASFNDQKAKRKKQQQWYHVVPRWSLKEHCVFFGPHGGQGSGSAAEQLVGTQCVDQRPLCRQDACWHSCLDPVWRTLSVNTQKGGKHDSLTDTNVLVFVLICLVRPLLYRRKRVSRNICLFPWRKKKRKRA